MTLITLGSERLKFLDVRPGNGAQSSTVLGRNQEEKFWWSGIIAELRCCVRVLGVAVYPVLPPMLGLILAELRC